MKPIMKKAAIRFNYSDYMQLPEDKRYEILDGDLCMVPAPGIKHQTVGLKLKTVLFAHIAEKRLGRLLDAPCDVVLSDEDVVQPDIIFIRKERSGIIGEQNVRGAPDLVVEILSTATRGRDLEVKRKIYAAYGVPEYWIVDPEAESIEILVRSEKGYASAGVFSGQVELSSSLLPDLSLTVSDVFRA